MDNVFVSDVFGQMTQIFVWGGVIALCGLVITRVAPAMVYWSALWKVMLLICLMPMVPWSQFGSLVPAITVTNTFLAELPELWGQSNAGSHASVHVTGAGSEQAAKLQAMWLTVVPVLMVSTIKLLTFAGKLYRFNDYIENLQTLDINTDKLICLTAEQKAYIERKNVKLLGSNQLTSPFTTGLINPRIVLPESFFYLPVDQKRLLVEHELNHIRRGDLYWLTLGKVLAGLFWFCPAVYLINPKLELALEVETDRRVLNTFKGMSKEYGRAIISTVKQTRQPVHSAAAYFINQQFTDLRQRIRFTQSPVTDHGESVTSKMTLLLVVLLFSATSWAINTNGPELMSVEEFVKLHKHASRYIDDPESVVLPSGTWVNPVKTSWVSSTFKVKHKFRYYKPHLGIDLAASLGDDIVAANDGVVIVADSISLHKDHGNVVIIDHGNQILTMYSHMDSFDVNKGDRVSSGQLIGKVGKTGRTTGPHLHFEVITADRHIDPADIIAFNYK